MFSSVVLSLLIAEAAGHGAIVTPRSRNSIDYLVGVNVPAHWPSDRDCTNITGGPCNNGQAPFWYSQGCFIGCPSCDHLSGRRQVDLCGLGKKATINDPYRTVNRDSVVGSPEDIYKHNPWRAAGTAPVADACGLAGGTPWAQEVSEAGVYSKTKFAQHGMNGTLLPPLDTVGGPGAVEWTIGGTAEVTWQVENNHGGGYSWRLCPAEEPLTEVCFQKHQLDFVEDEQGIVFKNGTVVKIKGSFVTEGTYPQGSMWSMIPFPPSVLGPRCLPGENDTASTPNGCKPWEREIGGAGPCVPCPGTPGSDCSRCGNGPKPNFEPRCEGCVGDHRHAVRDVVKVPSDLPPGKYILGWRWDCEATAQVWSGCSDITLVKAPIVV